jgi:hypothetical protein
VALGVGVVGVGAGVVCALLAQQVFADADDALSRTTSANERARIRDAAIASGEPYNTAAVWSWIGGGAVAVVGAAVLAVGLVGGE